MRAYGPGLRAFRTAGLACLLAVGAAGLAHAATLVEWGLFNQPDVPIGVQYAPPAAYSYNSSGGSIAASRTAPGDYEVGFAGFASSADNANVQITAYNTSNRCTSYAWGPVGKTNELAINVACYDPSGKPADTSFTLLYQSRTADFGSGGKGLAYAMTGLSPEDKPPPAITGFNSTGGSIGIARNQDAGYTVTLAGLARSGDVQVRPLWRTPRKRQLR